MNNFRFFVCDVRASNWYTMLLRQRALAFPNRYHDLSHLALTCLFANILKTKKIETNREFSEYLYIIYRHWQNLCDLSAHFQFFVDASLNHTHTTPPFFHYDTCNVKMSVKRASKRNARKFGDFFCRCVSKSDGILVITKVDKYIRYDIYMRKGNTKKNFCLTLVQCTQTDFSMYYKRTTRALSVLLICVFAQTTISAAWNFFPP